MVGKEHDRDVIEMYEDDRDSLRQAIDSYDQDTAGERKKSNSPPVFCHPESG